MTNLAGQWKYQSYRPDPVNVAADPTPPKFVVWSPPGVVTIDACGTTGNLVFPTKPLLKLDLKIQVIDGKPERVSISAVMNLSPTKKFTNELQGFLVPATSGPIDNATPLVVRGSIVLTSEDIDPTTPQPLHTTGFFVLEPV